MFINLTSLVLNSTPGTNSQSGHSARDYPLPASLPLSTLLLPPTYQTSTQSLSEPQSLPDSRSPQSSLVLLPTMSSAAGGLGFLPTSLGPQSQSSTPSTSDSPATSTDAASRTGRSLPSSFALTSKSDISASTSSPPNSSWMTTPASSTSGTMLISPSVSSLPPTLSLSVTSRSASVFTFTFTPTSILPFPTDSTTQSSSSPASVSSTSSQIPASTSSPSSGLASTSSALPSTSHTSSPVPETTTVVIPTTVPTTVAHPSPSTSTYMITSVLLGNGGTLTDFVTSSAVLSTQTPSGMGSSAPPSPGTIVGVVLGIVGAVAFAALWLFCARRRHRKLVQEAAFMAPPNHGPPPLGDEVRDVEELGYRGNALYGTGSATTRSGAPMEERYAGILAALHSTEGFGRGHTDGSTGGVYGSQRDGATDGDDDIARASSPTLPIYSLPPEDAPYTFALSPPPPVPSPSHQQVAQYVPPPPSAYHTSRRRSSPGPDAAAWLGGYSVAPSCNSHYARSQTLGSGSGSGSVDALTRTRTGSEEPLIGIRKPSVELSQGVPSVGGISPTTTTDPGGNRLGLGSAFGSPEGSMYSPSAISPPLYRDMSGSYDARSTFGSGSYGHTRSGTPSSFDVLRSVSSQGALSSAYSHGHGPNQGFRFGFSRPGSTSSGSTGKKRGSARHSFGVPPTSFRAWRDWGSGSVSDKEKQVEKQSFRERDWRRRTGSATSASSLGSMDEKQEKSPVVGVRALLERLRRAGHTPSPRSSSDRDLASPTLRTSTDVDPEKATGKMSVERRVTPPPPPIQVQAATPKYRRQYSFILSNPDPHPPSPYSGAGDVAPLPDVGPHEEILPNPHDIPLPHPNHLSPSTGELRPGTPPPVGYAISAPSPAPTEESRLVEGLLHPRLRAQGRSDASLMDFEDYSRPIGGVVKNRLYSTTTFGTQDDMETTSPSGGTAVKDLQETADLGDEREHGDEQVDVFGAATVRMPRESWFVDETQHGSARHSPVRV